MIIIGGGGSSINYNKAEVIIHKSPFEAAT